MAVDLNDYQLMLLSYYDTHLVIVDFIIKYYPEGVLVLAWRSKSLE